MRGIFIGKDGSMGFMYGKEYQFYTCDGFNACLGGLSDFEDFIKGL